MCQLPSATDSSHFAQQLFSVYRSLKSWSMLACKQHKFHQHCAVILFCLIVKSQHKLSYPLTHKYCKHPNVNGGPLCAFTHFLFAMCSVATYLVNTGDQQNLCPILWDVVWCPRWQLNDVNPMVRFGATPSIFFRCESIACPCRRESSLIHCCKLTKRGIQQHDLLYFFSTLCRLQDNR